MLGSLDAVDTFASLLLLWYLTLLPSLLTCKATGYAWNRLQQAGVDTSSFAFLPSHTHMRTTKALLRHQYARALIQAIQVVTVAAAASTYDSAGLDIDKALETVSIDIRLPITALSYVKSIVDYFTANSLRAVTLVVLLTMVFSLHNNPNGPTCFTVPRQHVSTQTVGTGQDETTMRQPNLSHAQESQAAELARLRQEIADRDHRIQNLISENDMATGSVAREEENARSARRALFAAREEFRVLENTHEDTLELKDQMEAALNGRIDERDKTILEYSAIIETLTNDISENERQRKREESHTQLQNLIREGEEKTATIASLRESCENLQQQKSSFESELSAQRTHCAGLHCNKADAIAEHNSIVRDLDDRIRTLDNTVTERNTQISTLKGSITQLGNTVAQKDRLIATLKEQGRTLEKDLATTRRQLDDTNQENLPARISNLETQLQQKITETEQLVHAQTQFDADKANLQARVSELEHQLQQKIAVTEQQDTKIGEIERELESAKFTLYLTEQDLQRLVDGESLVQRVGEMNTGAALKLLGKLVAGLLPLLPNPRACQKLLSKENTVTKVAGLFGAVVTATNELPVVEGYIRTIKTQLSTLETAAANMNAMVSLSRDSALTFATQSALCEMKENTEEEKALKKSLISLRQHTQTLASFFENSADGTYVATLHGADARHGHMRAEAGGETPMSNCRQAPYNPLLNANIGTVELFDRVVDHEQDFCLSNQTLLNKSGWTYGAMSEAEGRGAEILALRRMNWEVSHIIQARSIWSGHEKIVSFLTTAFITLAPLSQHTANSAAEASQDSGLRLGIRLFKQLEKRIARLVAILNGEQGFNGTNADISELDPPIEEEELLYDQYLARPRAIKPTKRK